MNFKSIFWLPLVFCILQFFAQSSTPIFISGVYPHLAVFNQGTDNNINKKRLATNQCSSDDEEGCIEATVPSEDAASQRSGDGRKCDIETTLPSGSATSQCLSDGWEVGIGAIVPWADKLWMVTYSPRCPHGSSDKLYSIDNNLELTIHHESIGGAPAN